MDQTFSGEHLFAGHAGQFFVVLSFGTALLAAISYYFSTIKDTADGSWLRIARIATWLNTVSVIGIGASLFYIIYNHLFEYHYAWAHSSRALPVYYIVSCFWEGQEGSFWLWTFWQAVLANILVWKAKTWESPVMTIVMVSQAMLASMLLGVEIFGERIGSSPFILLRDAVNLKEMAPVLFADPANYANYLTYIQDGNGLNPLLQNYWMVIHPPTLFLGFASMIVPFAYAIAGLWQRRFSEWVKPVFPWALFACMILGTGIIMGSFWAYEALNFGGFWAWDPVENASIIPWITLIAAMHVMLAYKNSGHSYFTATFLVLISFVLVLYASFLTRSGILGETSVHAFTDLGMFWHLVIDIVLFGLLAIYFLVSRWKQLPITRKDEETYSREFWLFIGSLVLVVACLQVIGTTSLPVVNAMFGTKFTIKEPIETYNKWQTNFATVIAILSGLSQFLKYKNSDPGKFYKKLGITAAISAVLTVGAMLLTGVYSNPMLAILSFAAFFTIAANGDILLGAIRGKWKLAGSSVAHIGFGLILVGALVAAYKNKVISINNSGAGIPVKDFEKTNKSGENIMLYKDEPVQMDKYTVTYVSDTTDYPNTFYKVNYKVFDKDGKIEEEFNLYPNAQQNEKMGLISSPDTKHYLTHDIYTHATAAPQIADHQEHEGHTESEEYQEPLTFEVNVGDTVRYKGGFIVVVSVNKNATIKDIPLEANDIAVGMNLEVHAGEKIYPAEPLYLLKGGNQPMDFGRRVDDAGLMVRFTKINPDKNNLELLVYQKKVQERKWIVMKAIVFPYINLFWGGTIIMVAGFLLSILRRNKELKRN
ncbi:heme lyase CcmF/NrfE family subunit [Hufsiella ginkgonis]|uniref:Cytochrome C biogenesis protein n=1 Tax=Hufsiella ginkgonis TaxID=2695274 RepID=A0A7K1XX65_9SPHI|nr:cytochrome c biogenesis protein CcsA [Hufsiella ginkgonis]MXV15595.1 cytochrome C biogenesis protein [Hufsiella ginkgonis]